MYVVIPFLAMFALAALADPAPQVFRSQAPCPPAATHELTPDELSLLSAVAAHYKKSEWPAAKGTQSNTFSSDRHAVPSLKSPQVFLLDPSFGTRPSRSGIDGELMRHAVPAPLRAELVNALESRNRKHVVFRPPQSPNLVSIALCEVVRAAYAGETPKGNRDLTNTRKAIEMLLPAFDATGRYALVLASNDVTLALEGRPDPELIFARNDASTWKIEWHVGVSECATGAADDPGAADSRDFAVFSAVLARLDKESITDPTKPVSIASQTRTWQEGEILFDGKSTVLDQAAATRLSRRNTTCVYIGSFAPARKYQLVPREEVGPSMEIGRNSVAVQFTLPVYASDGTALVAFGINRRAGKGSEFGPGTASLRKSQGQWRVERFYYERAIGDSR